ncbi:MAG: IS200/IS605 family accessory protein TnpB-related protein [Candidatus Hermodarchaeota archaeon]
MQEKGYKQTIIFRIYPTTLQERNLHDIFKIYNRVKRIGYKLLFQLKHIDYTQNERSNIIQPQLMQICDNNPYVNSILKDNETKFAQQQTWHKKRKNYLEKKIKTISEKIYYILQENTRDRRLKGLYSKLSSVQNRLRMLELKPVVFGTKQLFRERIRQKISRKEFIIRRDASFCCVGKKQGVNLNIKLFENKTLRIHRFSKEKGKEWLFIPFTVNATQEQWFEEILRAKKYTVTVKRRLIKGKLRYFAHVTYDIPESEIEFNFEKGAIGLDFNYNFVSLCNVSESGDFKSYHEIYFRNLHTLRKNCRENYISYKMDKIVNYCANKRKGLVIEDLSFDQEFSYGKKRNRKLSNLKISALTLLERKCLKRGVTIRKVHPAYTSLIGKYKFSRLYNLSTHVLASYVIARKGLKFKEELPAIYKWLFAQVGDSIKPRLNPSSPYYRWAKLHDFFKHSGITSFKTSEVTKKALQMKYVLNSATSAQSDNLRAGLSRKGKIEDWYKFWNFIEISNYL